MAERDLANTWADRMMETAERDPKSLILVIADMARSSPPMASAFVAELAQTFARSKRGSGARVDLDRTTPRRIAPDDRTTGAGGEPAAGVGPGFDQQQHQQPSLSERDRLARLRRSHQRRRRNTASGPSGRLCARWSLRPATAIAMRPSGSRSRAALTEAEVAAKAIELASCERLASEGSGDRAAHVGFYLIDKGLPRARTRRRRSASRRCAALRRHRNPISAALHSSVRSR